jgi:pilus assembly protein Flp/PilA
MVSKAAVAGAAVATIKGGTQMAERNSLFMGRVMTTRLADLKRQEGQGVTEYGIVLAFVAVALLAILILLKGHITTFINKVGADLDNLPTGL